MKENTIGIYKVSFEELLKSFEIFGEVFSIEIVNEFGAVRINKGSIPNTFIRVRTKTSG